MVSGGFEVGYSRGMYHWYPQEIYSGIELKYLEVTILFIANYAYSTRATGHFTIKNTKQNSADSLRPKPSPPCLSVMNYLAYSTPRSRQTLRAKNSLIS